MIESVVDSNALSTLRQLSISHPSAVLVPVRARDLVGRNVLPVAYAETLAGATGWKIAEGIVQVSDSGRPGMTPMERFVNAPVFAGVADNREYVLVDDVVTYGGVLSALRIHIASQGGRVIAATTLALSHPDSKILPLRQSTIRRLEGRFGLTALEVRRSPER